MAEPASTAMDRVPPPDASDASCSVLAGRRTRHRRREAGPISHFARGARLRRGAIATAALAALILALSCTAASPQGKIVIHGADSGSHLRLNVRGGKMVVRGWMSRARPAGCRYARPRTQVREVLEPLLLAGEVTTYGIVDLELL